MNFSSIQFPGNQSFSEELNYDSFSNSNPFENEDNIHIHLTQNGRKKITMINGLKIKEKKDCKIFLKDAQTFFATSGYYKLILEINKHKEIPCFQGDIRYGLADYLAEKYQILRDQIHIHGA